MTSKAVIRHSVRITDQVVSYHPLDGLRVRASSCAADLSPLGLPGTVMCQQPVTQQIVYFVEDKPYWVDWWCEEHGNGFTEDDDAA